MGKKMKSLIEAHGTRESKEIFEKWSDNIKAVQSVDNDFSDEEGLKLGIVLENTHSQLNKAEQVYEATQPVDVGPFKKYAFDIVTAVMPNLIAEDIVSVQPLKQKLGQIFYLEYLYGSDKGNISKGDTMAGPYQAGPQGYDANQYSSEYVENEQLGDAGETDYTGNLAYVPLRPGTVSIDFGGGTATDDGQGNLTGSGVSSGSIDYSSGEFSLTLSSNAANPPEATYQYNLEAAPSTIPEVNLKVSERIVTARARKLKALYAFDSAYDLKMSQGIDIDQALLEAISSEIKHEIDGEIMNDLYQQAGLSSSWNMTRPDYISQREHRESFISEISSASNQIFQETRRAVGNYIVVGKKGADVLESLGEPRYKANDVGTLAGPHLAGVLDNKWKVYKNPFYGEYEYLVGFKGDLFLDAGYVYAPYLPVFATSLLMMEDFVGRRGFATSYGKRMLNNRVFVSGNITTT
jgi:hypothetical protein